MVALRRHRGVFVSIATALAIIASSAAAAAQDSDAAAVELTPETAQDFLDERLPALLDAHGAPGIAAVIVADGEQAAAGGYGYANVKQQQAISPSSTAFETASVAKSFTTMAVLQLVDRGLLDLHADINTYLGPGAEVADTYPGQPVTMHHLLTHTAGFEDALSGDGARSADELPTLEEYVTRTRMKRVQPPGRFVAYSNYGMSLAGFVVQEVTGTSFEDYTSENIFGPLGMASTEFLPASEAREKYDVATTYYADGSPTMEIHLAGAPAGTAVSTAEDMSRFIRTLLHGGELDGQRVLSPESTQQMLTRQSGMDPRVTGAGYGTWEFQLGPPSGLGHGGDLPGIHTMYVVVPELDMGIYVAVNGDDGENSTASNPLEDLRFSVVKEFLDTFAAESAWPDAAPDPSVDLSRYEGTFVTTRNSVTDFSKLRVFMDNLSVSANDNGTLSIEGFSALDQTWFPAGEGLFVAENREDMAAFVEEDGRVIALALNINPTQAYEKAAWYEQPRAHLISWAAATLVLLTVLAWPVAAAIRWIRRRAHRDSPRGASLARLIAGLAAASSVALIALLAYGLANNAVLEQWLFTSPAWLLLPVTVGALAAAASVVAAVVSWRRGWWSTFGRVHYSLVALAALLFVSLGWTYNLMWTPFG
ncbi:serine hydrolase domain-containing protein [Hoyosella altamirensis]|uniref:CubicO group peptidase (Beta-lactamase class C family) n=1 Tax=Hoyosella altamirensis TaxID=616997 RepID=A0A839RJ68_9ACTN|nr:serine hydrolase domain-containing protein [Hoyosella altamirensis]MBB3036872.1 CubicO group peptidase (beta-lactamase class C family) [Hoyosella altamirensis]